MTDTQSGLTLPGSLAAQLRAFRNRVWTTKVAEAVTCVAVVVLCAFLTVYFLDRRLDTPVAGRLVLWLVSLLVWALVPYAVYRWVWQNRRLEQTARLLRRRDAAMGDQLLSVIELSKNEREQSRSQTLCAAAIRQVAEVASGRDLLPLAPPSMWKVSTAACAALSAFLLGIVLLFPAAASNAWQRFFAPWRDVARYTFTKIESMPAAVVVPHGEPSAVAIKLDADSVWQPATATLTLGRDQRLSSTRQGDQYAFELPPQVSTASVLATTGDFFQSFSLVPKTRPELVTAKATLHLPDYLERPEAFEQDVRGGRLLALIGSSVQIVASASRDLAAARVTSAAGTDVELRVQQSRLETPVAQVHGTPQVLSFTWKDNDNLAGRTPFELTIEPLVDQAPTVVAQGLARQSIVLDSEQLNFEVLASDDFGVRRLGLDWTGLDEVLNAQLAGERTLAAGDPFMTSVQVAGTFSASSLGIPAQPIEVRMWVEDYMPGRERVYSPPHVLYVLTAEQHVVWVTNEINKWHRASLDIRDQELQLYAANQNLRQRLESEMKDASPASSALAEEVARQAALETANSRRLDALLDTGEQLLRQASRNPQVAVANLERWAEILQTLNDIGENRMPSVANLLADAAQQQKAANKAGDDKPAGKKSEDPSAPVAGQVRASPDGNAEEGASEKETQPKDDDEGNKLPSVVDVESTAQPDGDAPQADSQDGKKPPQPPSTSRLSMPTTTLMGPPEKAGPDESDSENEPEDEPKSLPAFALALEEQQRLLEEFQRVEEQLNAVLADLEGSTLVKRLKAASREQTQIADQIIGRLANVFGQPQSSNDVSNADRSALVELSQAELASSEQVSYIMDDLQSYYERRRMENFGNVLGEMRESEVTSALSELGDVIPVEHGVSVSQAEYWADTLDRWAEDLVESSPASDSKEPSEGQASDAMPPALLLESLKILEAEVNLREETRVAEQSKAAIELAKHQAEASRLSGVQHELGRRLEAVNIELEALPEGDARFKAEIDLFASAASVMREAAEILNSGETGSTAMAAQTEAIEMLLKSKRINPKKSAGAGGNATPGSGSTGTTEESALALLGVGLNQQEQREPREVTQATGERGRVWPEEYRAGLDAYFNRLEAGETE